MERSFFLGLKNYRPERIYFAFGRPYVETVHDPTHSYNKEVRHEEI